MLYTAFKIFLQAAKSIEDKFSNLFCSSIVVSWYISLLSWTIKLDLLPIVSLINSSSVPLVIEDIISWINFILSS